MDIYNGSFLISTIGLTNKAWNSDVIYCHVYSTQLYNVPQNRQTTGKKEVKPAERDKNSKKNSFDQQKAENLKFSHTRVIPTIVWGTLSVFKTTHLMKVTIIIIPW